MPLDGVVRDAWRDVVLATDPQGRTRILRIPYEMCVLQALRDQLRCKELWVVGADRYRNPDDDVPSDFASQRPAYYAALKLPSQAEDFLRQLQHTMRDELAALDRTLPYNAEVTILPKGKGWIKLSPLAVVDCNRNQPGLQSAHFPDHIICIYRRAQDDIKCD